MDLQNVLQSAKQKGETYLEETIAIHFAGSGDAAERRPVRGGRNGVAAGNSGSCGGNLTWSLSGDGTLTISGTGPMANYKSSDTAPYYNAPWGSDALRLKIKRLVVNEGITSIGDLAFYCCNNLTSVSLPNSLERIGSAVFFECSSLTSLVIPDNVTNIDSDLCAFCSSLKTVKLPKRLMSCGGALFAGCTSLTSVALPENLNGIPWRMFYDCSSLTTISIPVSVDFIDEEAFSGCNALSTVNYSGSQSDWKNIPISSGNQPLTTAAMKYAPSSVAGPTVTGRVDQYGELTLCWTAVENTKEYQLWYKDTISEYPHYGLMAVMSGDALSRDGYFFQTEGHTYSYKIRAHLADGSYSRFSNAYTFTYEPKAAVPSNVELVGGHPCRRQHRGDMAGGGGRQRLHHLPQARRYQQLGYYRPQCERYVLYGQERDRR